MTTLVRNACRAVGTAALAHATFVNTNPNSSYTRALANVDAAEKVTPDHPLYHLTHTVANILGMEVEQGDSSPLTVYVSQKDHCMALGSRRDAMVVLPSTFMEDPDDLKKNNQELEVKLGKKTFSVDPALALPSDEEIMFSIAHELSHINFAHSFKHNLAFPAVLLVANEVLTRTSATFVKSSKSLMVRGFKHAGACFAAAGLATFALARYQEEEADDNAARHGFATAGVQAFSRMLAFNGYVKDHSPAISKPHFMITRRGNFLFDLEHPSLTHRLTHCMRISQSGAHQLI